MAEVKLAEGAAAATPSANQVTLYAKADGLLYSKDDAGTETSLGGGAHAMLSTTHSDSAASAVTRGSLIVGNVTPAWAELNIGLANRVLGSDGTDAAWVQADHGAALTGLTDDDHTQYLLAAGTRALSADWDAGSFEIRAQTFESDVVTGTAPLVIASTTKVTNLNADLLDDQTGTYYLDSANFTGTNWTDLTDAGATTLHKHDHGGLDGLTDDDHTQYALLAGRSTGQILTGGTGASEDLTLRSTTNATKGDIFLADQGGNVTVGGGTAATEVRLLEPSASGVNYTAIKVQAQAGDITYTLPAANATNGVLLNDGSGGLTWDTNIADLIDHGTTTGLADDDHTQYTLLAGRSTGQIITGGTGASEDLTLRSTTNATKGDIILVDQGGNVTIGGGTTASELRIYEASGSGTNYSALKVQAQAGNITYTLPAADGSNTQVLTTNGSGTLSWAAGGTTKPFLSWTAQGNQPPAAAYATPDTRNSHPVLDFDGATDEEAVFGGVLPTAYAGGGLTVELWVGFTSATTGSAHFQAAIERMDVSTLDIDADSFAALNESDAITAPGTSGQFIKATVTFTDGADMDSLAAGEAFRLKIRRDADGTGGTDDITTDAELFRIVMRET